jgi:hypothetical protein
MEWRIESGNMKNRMKNENKRRQGIRRPWQQWRHQRNINGAKMAASKSGANQSASEKWRGRRNGVAAWRHRRNNGMAAKAAAAKRHKLKWHGEINNGGSGIKRKRK